MPACDLGVGDGIGARRVDQDLPGGDVVLDVERVAPLRPAVEGHRDDRRPGRPGSGRSGGPRRRRSPAPIMTTVRRCSGSNPSTRPAVGRRPGSARGSPVGERAGRAGDHGGLSGRSAGDRAPRGRPAAEAAGGEAGGVGRDDGAEVDRGREGQEGEGPLVVHLAAEVGQTTTGSGGGSEPRRQADREQDGIMVSLPRELRPGRCKLRPGR